VSVCTYVEVSQDGRCVTLHFDDNTTMKVRFAEFLEGRRYKDALDEYVAFLMMLLDGYKHAYEFAESVRYKVLKTIKRRK